MKVRPSLSSLLLSNAGDSDSARALSRAGLLLPAIEVCNDLTKQLEIRLSDALNASGFGSQSAGLGIFFATLFAVTGDSKYEVFATTMRERIISALALQPQPTSFHSGFPGSIWTVDFIDYSLTEKTRVDTEKVDGLLRRMIRHGCDAFECSLDIVNGLSGLGLYLISRPRALDRGTHLSLLKCFSNRLDGDLNGRNICSPFKAPTVTNTGRNFTSTDLGIAHGLGGIALFIIESLKKTSAFTQMSKNLLRRVIDIILLQRCGLDGDEFPYAVGGTHAARYAWCYGTPGIAMILLRASYALEDPLLKALGAKIALNAASRRDLSELKVVDSSVCHGTAGLSLLFHRIALSSGSRPALGAAHFWLKETLVGRAEAKSAGKFSFYDCESQTYVQDDSILQGAPGVGLVLLSMLSSKTRAWDYPLGTSYW